GSMASARLPTFAPGRGTTDERARPRWPFTKTSRVPASPRPSRSTARAGTPFGVEAKTGVHGTRTTGSTFVYFQSSSFVVGNPRLAKLSMAARRTGASQSPASPAASSERQWPNQPSIGSRPGVIALSHRGLRGRCDVLDPVVAAGLQLESQLLAARAHDAAVPQDVHDVGGHVVQEPLVVRHQDHRVVGPPECLDAARHDPEGVDVEARVGLVEYRELRLEHRHLEDLVALLLAAREALVDRARHERLVHLHDLEPLLQEGEELDGVQLVEAAGRADLVERRAQEVGAGDARDLGRILEG